MRAQTITEMKRLKAETLKTLMERYFKIEIFVDNSKTATISKFDAKNVKKPMDGQEKGWYMDFKNPGDDLKIAV